MRRGAAAVRGESSRSVSFALNEEQPISQGSLRRGIGLKKRKKKKEWEGLSSETIFYILIALLLYIIAAFLGLFVYVFWGRLFPSSPPGPQTTASVSHSAAKSDTGNGAMVVNNLRNEQKSGHFPPAFPVISRGEGTKLSTEALEMCTRTLWHTLETTTIVLPNEETFIHTGDIDDLWLRVRTYYAQSLTLCGFDCSHT
jgi:hypothetical protein